MNSGYEIVMPLPIAYGHGEANSNQLHQKQLSSLSFGGVHEAVKQLDKQAVAVLQRVQFGSAINSTCQICCLQDWYSSVTSLLEEKSSFVFESHNEKKKDKSLKIHCQLRMHQMVTPLTRIRETPRFIVTMMHPL